MKIHTLQKEYTYNVETAGGDYTVTILEDIASGYIDYTVFNDDGEEVEDERLVLALVEAIENNIP
jgi:hypothetical protein